MELGWKSPTVPLRLQSDPLFSFLQSNFFTRMKRILFTFCGCFFSNVLWSAPTASFSQDTTSDNSRNLPNLEVLSQKEEKSISASVPFHQITSEKILQTGITDIADAIKRLPGVNLRDYGGAGGLKTVSVRGLGAQHTGVAYDGIPLSDLRSGEIDLSRYSLNNLSTLALTSGDNDDIFGPARNIASASTIFINTLKSPDLWERSLELDTRMKVGAFQLYNPFLHVGYSNGSNFSLSATGEFFHAKNDYPFTLYNGDHTTREKRSNSRMNSVHSEVNFLFKPTHNSSLSTKLYYYDNSRQLPGPVIYYTEDSNEHLHDRNFFAQTRWKSKLSSAFSIMGLAKFNWASSRYQDVDGIYPGGRLDQNYIQREAFSSAALLYIPAAGWAIDYSADWFYNNLSSNLSSDVRPFRNSILQAISAKFNSGCINVTGRLLYSIFLDRSLDALNNGEAETRVKKNSSRLSPSVSISVRPVKTIPLYFRASYKNIFRMPTFNELYFDNYGTVSLKPEITDQWNVGFTFSAPSLPHLKDLSLIVDGYLNKVKDKIVAVPYNLFKWSMTNLGKVRIYGLDITLNAEIELASCHSILIDGSYSYQRAQPHTSPDKIDWMKQVAYTPLNSGAASISWLNPWVNLAIHSTATSARYTTNANIPSTRISGYADFGASLSHIFSLKKGKLELRADLMNVLNKQYEIVARYPMPGRSWTASVGYKF